MLAGDGGVIERHVAGPGPAHGILPVGQGLLSAVGQRQVAPHLRQVRHGEEGADGPHQNEQGQHGEDKAGDGGIPRRDHGISAQKRRQLVHNGLRRGKYSVHCLPSLSLKLRMTRAAARYAAVAAIIAHFDAIASGGERKARPA
ncbi:hypothetical protein KL86CLO1_11237 [uncultured Eubacteriales bacterium]|uniref:Uncharacterized protein n=1 Tax=uncultured Eubacteriales bacterium TaxID=172733 RepID=A0A212JJN5_9FIRM|nr:hypothetical protein KL86CLO1_11237 [uncultured Eubacteriales bacterium]